MAYIIILPDPDWRHRCRHRGGDPDCSCFPECPECGTIYTPTDGHDCLDDVPADELLDAAKELRDSLDACETERDRLRAQIAALQAVPQGVELTEDDVRRALMSNAIDVDVEGVTPRLNRIIVSRLAPTPPQADAVAVPRPLSEAPTDRPVLAFWQSGLGTISDVVHYFDEEGRFVCWCEMLEHEDNGGDLDFVPRDAQWIELPDALRTSAQDHNGEGAK